MVIFSEYIFHTATKIPLQKPLQTQIYKFCNSQHSTGFSFGGFVNIWFELNSLSFEDQRTRQK